MAASSAQLTPLTVATALEEGEAHLTAMRRSAAGERLAARERRRALARALRSFAARLDGGESLPTPPNPVSTLSAPRTPEAPA